MNSTEVINLFKGVGVIIDNSFLNTENKEDRIKATLRWLSTKSKNTITLLMPLLEIVVKYLLTKQI